MKSPYEIIDDQEPVNPMTKEEKLSLARWFYRICASILSCSWPVDEINTVKTRVACFMETAQALEKEALTGLHRAEIHQG
jgi:hypothetical protein